MSFLVAAALALGLFVVGPVAAHLLRRGRAAEQEFPPARLVPVAYRSARQRSRLEDRWLLLIRALMILTLSVVGAVPFVRCSRLALDRDAGASVALALVIDDSLSMRTSTNPTETRWALAIKGARDLLESTREGDAVGIVLSGKPARLALSATTDLSVVRETLDKLKPMDRSTDLRAAVRLAESALKTLPHIDKRIVVLSDFADAAGPTEKDLWTPLPELRKPSANCGIARARKDGNRVLVNVVCTNANAASDRHLRLTRANGTEPNPKGTEVADVSIKAIAGSQTVDLRAEGDAVELDAFLTGSDALAHDDYAPVAQAEGALLVGVVADPATAAAQEGTATVIEQALLALTSTTTPGQGPVGDIRPLPVVPEDEKELEPYAALIIDDPPGLSPESRTALSQWLANKAGFAAAFLGPNVQAAQLGSSFEPFAHGALTWETTTAHSIVDTSGFLGDASASLREIAPQGRLRLGGALLPDSQVMLTWEDESPWMLLRRIGRGQAWTFGLPVSVDQSDLALRPGFLALLEKFLHDAAQASGQRVTEAGTTWRLANTTKSVEGPEGPVEVEAGSDAGNDDDPHLSPALRGRYRIVEANGDVEERVVTLDETEIVQQPRPIQGSLAPRTAVASPPKVEVSREFGLLLLAFLLVELLLRVATQLRLRNQNPA